MYWWKNHRKRSLAKKILYVSLFVLLGALVSFIVAALLETLIIAALVTNFERFNLGLSWKEWIYISRTCGAVILFSGALLGYLKGVAWWRIVYKKGLIK